MSCKLLTIVTIVVCLSFLACAAPNHVKNRTKIYPSWFLATPGGENETYVVGYSRRFENTAKGYELARENAVLRLAMIKKAKIRLRYEHFQIAGKSRWLPEYSDIEIDSINEDVAKANIKFIDSTIVGNMVLILAAKSNNTLTDNAKKSVSLSKNKPEWLNKLPKNENTVYSIGTAPLYFYEHHSWQKAEENALKQLAMSVELRIRQARFSNQSVSRSWTETLSEVLLQNVRIIARWLDMKEKQCYVLAKMFYSQN